jgi:SAM-dependent methyltransferase
LTSIPGWITRTERRAPGWLRRAIRRPAALRRLAGRVRNRATWTAEYEAGVWDRLGDLQEESRFSVIAGYVSHIGGEPRVLDLGCGDGRLARRLDGAAGNYVGCDFAQPAVGRARHRQLPRAQFLVADASRPPFRAGTFDIVVCSEILYYLRDLPASLAAITQVLAPGGHLVVSVFDAFGRPQTACWDVLMGLCEVSDMVTLTSLQSQQTWRIALLRPRSNLSLAERAV